jgi:bile acid-coenzyme A ligase
VAVGVPDPDLGQRVHAVADVADAEADPEGLRVWANEHLDPEKRIDSLRIVREPVRDDAGKARRRDWAA